MFMDYIGKHDSTWKLKEEKTKAIVKRSSEIIFLYPSGLICPWVYAFPIQKLLTRSGVSKLRRDQQVRMPMALERGVPL